MENVNQVIERVWSVIGLTLSFMVIMTLLGGLLVWLIWKNSEKEDTAIIPMMLGWVLRGENENHTEANGQSDNEI